MAKPAPGDRDPDATARTHLANERTFLAWFRTGMTQIALGIAAAQFLALHEVNGVPLVGYLASVLVVSGVVMVAGGATRYYRTRSRVDAGTFVPASVSVAATTAAAVVTGVLALVFVWVVREGLA